MINSTKFSKSLLIIPFKNLGSNILEKISNNKDLIIKVEPDFKFYGLKEDGSEDYVNIFDKLFFLILFGNSSEKTPPRYEDMPYVSNENVSRVFINGCTNIIENPTPSNIPLPQGVKNEYDLSFDKNTFSNYETEINRYLTSIGRSTNYTDSFNYSFHDQLNQIIKNLDNEFNTYNNDNDLNDEMSLLSKEIYLYKELVKTQIDDKSISKNYDSNYINIIRILNGNILKHLDYYNQYYHLIRPISQEELDLIHLTADVFLKELEIEEGFNVKAGSSVAYKQDLIEFKYIDQNTLRKKTSPNYSKDKSRFGITLRIILKIYNDIHYGTDRDNISRNMETNLKVYKEILDMLQTFPCTKNLTTTRIGQIISKLKTEWDSTDKIVSSYVEDRNKTNYNTSAILNSVNALTSTLNNNKTSIKKECDSDTNGCNEAHIVVGTHSQYMTSRELFNSCLIIKEYIGPERIGKFIDVGTLYTKPMAIGGAISSEISDYKGLSSDKKKQLVYEFETEPKISRISENELKQKLFKKRGAGYVKLKNGNCRKSELHWYEIEAGYSETNIFNPTKVLRNFYYYQTHVATKNEGVKIDGWMGNEISCEGVK
jgi:hypothetical protein